MIQDRVEVRRDPLGAATSSRSLHPLNDDQKKAMDAIVEASDRGGAERFLSAGRDG